MDKDEKVGRMFYSFKENDEIIKIELLNFTCCRLKDLSLVNNNIFRTENLYNLYNLYNNKLYKFKALCDRPDTIKDPFYIYFILRDLSKINIITLIKDVNKKFADAIGIKYSKKHITTSLNHKLD